MPKGGERSTSRNFYGDLEHPSIDVARKTIFYPKIAAISSFFSSLHKLFKCISLVVKPSLDNMPNSNRFMFLRGERERKLQAYRKSPLNYFAFLLAVYCVEGWGKGRKLREKL